MKKFSKFFAVLAMAILAVLSFSCKTDDDDDEKEKLALLVLASSNSNSSSGETVTSSSGETVTEYTLTFALNGGTLSDGTASTVTFNKNTPAITLPTPTRDSDTFGGWYEDKYLSQKVEGETYAVSEKGADVTLYAKWIITATADNIADKIKALSGSSEIKASGEFTAETIYNKVNKVLNSLYESNTNIFVILDLSNVTGLTELTYKDSNSYVYGVFGSCDSLTSVTLPKSVTSISKYAFYGCHSLKSVTLPESVTSIGEYAFYYCSRLTSVTLPEGVTSIGEKAFCSCIGLTSVTIPESVTSIGVRAFFDCRSYPSVTFKDTTSNWKCGKEIISGSDLKDASTARKYLCGTYSDKKWTKVTTSN